MKQATIAIVLLGFLAFQNNSFAGQARGETYHQKPFLTVSPSAGDKLDGWLNNIVVSPDGKMVAGTFGTKLRFWSSDGAVLGDLSSMSRFTSLALSPSGKYLAAGTQGEEIQIYDMSNYRKVKTLKGEFSPIEALQFSANEKNLSSIDEDGLVQFWDIESESAAIEFTPQDDVLCSAFNMDGSQVAIGSEDGSMRVWKLPGKKLIKEWKTDLPKKDNSNCSVAFSPVAPMLAFSFEEQYVRYLSINSDSKKAEGGIWKAPSWIDLISFSPDGSSIILSDTKQVWQIDTKTQRPSQIMQGNYIPNSFTFTRDGKNIVIGGGETLKLNFWFSSSFLPDNLKDEMNTFYSILEKRKMALQHSRIGDMEGEAVAFSPDGTTIASIKHEDIEIWDSKNKNRLKTIKMSVPYSQYRLIDEIFFSNDGKRIYTLTNDGAFKVWDISSGKTLFSKDGVYRISIGQTEKNIVLHRKVFDSSDPFASQRNHDGSDTFELYRLNDWKMINSFSLKEDYVANVAYNEFSNSIYMFTGIASSEIVSYNFTTKKMQTEFKIQTLPQGNSFSLSSDGRFLAIFGNVWDLSNNQLIQSFSAGSNRNKFSPDGKILMTTEFGSDNKDSISLAAYNTSTGELMYHIPGYMLSIVQDIAFSADGSKVILASGNVYMLDALTGTPIK